MKSFYLLLTAAVIGFTSCRAKEGEPGPAGQSALKQQGEITGTIEFVSPISGNDTSIAFNLQYFESLNENTFSYQEYPTYSYYNFDFKRRDLQDYNCFVQMNGNGNGIGNTESDPSYSYMNFSLLKVINGNLYEFSSNNTVTITNVALDPTTGRLTYDYSGVVNYGSSQATVTGKVDVTLNRQGINTKS